MRPQEQKTDDNEGNVENPSEEYQRIASEIKMNCDKKYKKTWHCIVGENFGSFVTHESRTFIFFQIDAISILLYKTAKMDEKVKV